MLSSPANQSSRWPHRWAWLLACVTFPLVWWGGFVSATGSGMAFRDWLTSDGVFMPAYPWLSSAGDKFIEHGHRLLAMLTGVLTIGLVVVCWRCEPRRWVRWYSLALLAGVLAQGVLGGMRVLLDERVLALIHGCTGPLFFAAAAGMVAVTSRRWIDATPANEPSARDHGLLRLAMLTAATAYLQLVVGAVVRHSPHMLGDRAAVIFQTAVYFHIVLAAVVMLQVVWLAVACLRRRACVGGSLGLVALLVAQVLLGASSWVVKYGMPAWTRQLIGETGHFNRESDLGSAAIVAGHGAIGALIVACCVVIALHIGRRVGLHTRAHRAAPRNIAGVLA
jgi:cytochrome c oxidase assembly protein subunit 15